ncbi:MAG: MXAN_5187 C-terminal domain-containing protein, partial [Myxococcota bacterium]
MFGIAYTAVEQKIAPLVEASSKARADAQARAAALEVELAFVRSRRGLERAAFAVSKSPVFSDLGRGVPVDQRAATLNSALEAAVDQVGGEGRAALFDSRGAALAGAAALGETDAVRDARTGVASLRVEALDDASFEVVALPVGPEGGGAVLVLARPLGRARLAAWTRRLPLSTEVAVFDGAEPVADLLAPGTLDAIRTTPLPPVVEVDGSPRAVATLELADDGRAGLRVVTLAPVEDVTQTSIMDMIQLLVLGLGALSFGLCTVLLFLASDRSGASPVPETPFRSEAPIPPPEAPTPSPPFRAPVPPPTPSPAASGSVAAARPDALGTYSGVPAARSETFPSMGEDIDASPHSELDARPNIAAPAATPDWSRTASPNPVFGGGALPPLADLGRPTLAPISSTSEASPFASRPEGALGLDPNETPAPQPETPPSPMRPPSPIESERVVPAPPGPPPELPAPPVEPSFDAIARAAHSAPPVPQTPQAHDEENLPVPKGGLSPGMIAGQSLAGHGHVMAPSKRHEEDLPLPKEQASHLYDLGPSSSELNAVEARRTGPRGAPGLTGGSPSASGFTTPTSPSGSGVTSPRPPPPSAPAPTGAGGAASADPRPFDMEHYRRVYDEFVSAKERLGESVEGLSFEGFGAKLKASEEGLIERHSC